MRLQRPANGEGGVLHERPEEDPLYGTDQFYGYSGGWGKWQFGNNSTNWQGEELADMFVGWVYGSFSDASLGPDRRQFMDDRMPLLVNRAP